MSPVTWKVLASAASPYADPNRRRAPGSPARTAPILEPAEPRELLATIEASAVEQSPQARFRARPRHWTARGVLGTPWLHHTIVTGDVSRRRAPASTPSIPSHDTGTCPSPTHWLTGGANQTDSGFLPANDVELTGEFVFEVIDSARNPGTGVPYDRSPRDARSIPPMPLRRHLSCSGFLLKLLHPVRHQGDVPGCRAGWDLGTLLARALRAASAISRSRVMTNAPSQSASLQR